MPAMVLVKKMPCGSYELVPICQGITTCDGKNDKQGRLRRVCHHCQIWNGWE